MKNKKETNLMFSLMIFSVAGLLAAISFLTAKNNLILRTTGVQIQEKPLMIQNTNDLDEVDSELANVDLNQFDKELNLLDIDALDF